MVQLLGAGQICRDTDAVGIGLFDFVNEGTADIDTRKFGEIKLSGLRISASCDQNALAS